MIRELREIGASRRVAARPRRDGSLGLTLAGLAVAWGLLAAAMAALGGPAATAVVVGLGVVLVGSLGIAPTPAPVPAPAPGVPADAPASRERYVGDASRDAGETILGAIATGAFEPVYQPVLDLPSHRVVGFEALTRFDDGTPPLPVFAQAWRLGLGPELEEATFAAALAGAADLPAGTWLSLNVSPAFVLSGRPAPILAGAQRPVVLELTEHVAIEDYPLLRAAIEGLAPSVTLAVDDAGAGFASLRHVLELEPDIVKLDLALVRGVDADPARQALLASLCRFARKTGCRLLAEGIETEAELETIRSIGIGLGQGFLLGLPARPDPAAAPGSVELAGRRASRRKEPGIVGRRASTPAPRVGRDRRVTGRPTAAERSGSPTP